MSNYYLGVGEDPPPPTCKEGEILYNGPSGPQCDPAPLPQYCSGNYSPGLMAMDLPVWTLGGAVVGIVGASLLGKSKLLGVALGAVAGGAGSIGYYHAVTRPEDLKRCQALKEEIYGPQKK